MDIKYLIDYFAHASVKFTDVFTKKWNLVKLIEAEQQHQKSVD